MHYMAYEKNKNKTKQQNKTKQNKKQNTLWPILNLDLKHSRLYIFPCDTILHGLILMFLVCLIKF